MTRTPLRLTNKLGLHARAASKLVQTAARFDCEAWLEHQDRRVNARSIMGVLLLAAPCGSELILETSGEEAEEAAEAIRQLVEDRFGEGQ
ncbi:HPr family phosphocarrier protein [Wenzhouxiangella sp. AB-CW3]|uniref:HPr family phosphocarrier protein n=1 Tax=Wenzhouxiangella sp. AB-CW3 TaxID=2771012 RepID=UPI00168A6C9B|nr:HPr family phosphocarrier protein [Wenzhouxiangella sp. AB-CW3]QOC21888.1 HPr family phosphocarrier protein [Wenzhouxiangella sp. AB-CW3]